MENKIPNTSPKRKRKKWNKTPRKIKITEMKNQNKKNTKQKSCMKL